MNLRHALLASLMLCASAPLMARIPEAQLAQVVSSLSVSGTIEIDPQGKVVEYAIKDADAYEQAVRGLLDRAITRWTFKPVLVDGVARRARFDMYLRLEARPLEDKRYEVKIASAAFGTKEPAAPHTEVESLKMSPPMYPSAENRLDVGATVVTVLKIGRDGKVADVIVEQTNLKTIGRENDMKQWRRDFEHAAIAAARRFAFDTPTAGEDADQPYWSVRIPFTFTPANASATKKPGQWESYLPGPRKVAPWLRDGEKGEGYADALPSGRAFPLKQPLQLLTSLNAG